MHTSIKIIRNAKDFPTRAEVSKGSKKFSLNFDRDILTFDRDPPSEILDLFQLIYPYSEKPEPSLENPVTFRFLQLRETQVLGWFNGDHPKATVPPMLLLDYEINPSKIQEGIINRVHYQINSTNAATYTLMLYRASVGPPGAGSYANISNLIYESAAAQADDTEYTITGLSIPFKLGYPGQMWYALDWNVDPGATSGFIEVTGQTLR